MERAATTLNGPVGGRVSSVLGLDAVVGDDGVSSGATSSWLWQLTV